MFLYAWAWLTVPNLARKMLLTTLDGAFPEGGFSLYDGGTGIELYAFFDPGGLDSPEPFREERLLPRGWKPP